jgi:hypothetical protein
MLDEGDEKTGGTAAACCCTDTAVEATLAEEKPMAVEPVAMESDTHASCAGVRLPRSKLTTLITPQVATMACSSTGSMLAAASSVNTGT